MSDVEDGVDGDFHWMGDDISEGEDGDEAAVGISRRRTLGVQGI